MFNYKEALGEAFPLIEQYAPRVAQAIGGPMLGTAISALMLLAEHFNVDQEKHAPTLDAIKEAILNQPIKETILQNMANNFGKELLEVLREHFPKEIDVDTNIKF